MLIYVLAAIVVVLLMILFRYLPRRIFLIFVALLAVLGGVVFRMQTAERAAPPLTPEARAVIIRDQESFMPWWGTYQKQIAELDRNWTRYHQILSDAKEGAVGLSVTYARLSDLEQEMQELRSRIEKNAPPIELTDRIYDQLASILNKTHEYAAAEQKARAAADPVSMKEQKLVEQARLLELVMLRESPVALFIEDEVDAIRAYFAPVSAASAGEKNDGAQGEKQLDK